jgi:hypothetical protein
MDLLVQGLKSIHIRIYGFGGPSIVGAIELYKRLQSRKVLLAHPTLQTKMEVFFDIFLIFFFFFFVLFSRPKYILIEILTNQLKIVNDGLPPRVKVELETGQIAEYNCPMTVQDYVSGLNLFFFFSK